MCRVDVFLEPLHSFLCTLHGNLCKVGPLFGYYFDQIVIFEMESISKIQRHVVELETEIRFWKFHFLQFFFFKDSSQFLAYQKPWRKLNFQKRISVSYSTICRWVFDIDSILKITTWSKYYPKRGPTLHRFPCRVHENLWRGFRNTFTLYNLRNCPYWNWLLRK